MLTRRQFLVASGGVLLAGCGGSSLSSPTTSLPEPVVPTAQPVLLQSKDGLLEATLECRMGTQRCNGITATTPTYNGAFPGPTLKVRPGDTLKVHLVNNLPDDNDPIPPNINIAHHSNTTNLHVHGFHVSPSAPSDDVFLQIAPGQDYHYEFVIPEDHPTGTYFYHPHFHSGVTQQMVGGMGGAIIIEGDLDRVPEIAAAQDVVLVIQQLLFGDDGLQPPYNGDTFFDEVIETFTINGVFQPTIKIRQGEVQRWRLVHSGVKEYMPFGMDGHEFHVVALDGNPLPRTTTETELLLTPGQRADVLVKGGAPGTYQLHKKAFDRNSFPTPDLVMATLEVLPAEGLPAMALPTVLPVPSINRPIGDDEITGYRSLTFGFDGDFFAVDDKAFDPDRIDQTITLGAVEEWTLFNVTRQDHPMHIHVNDFAVVAVNGEPLPEQVFRDTVNIPFGGSVTIRHRFLDFEGLYVLHCHILFHECTGMMQVVDVVPPGLSKAELKRRSQRTRELMAKFAPPPRAEEFCGKPRPVLSWGRPTG